MKTIETLTCAINDASTTDIAFYFRAQIHVEVYKSKFALLLCSEFMTASE